MELYDLAHFYCVINASLSWISNIVLIVLIVQRSPKYLANYKYLMLVFAMLGLLFGFFDITNQPMLHFYKGSYVVFSRNFLGLPRRVAFWYIALNCSGYAMVLTLLAFHFVYRYLALCRIDLLKLFSFPYSLMLVLIFTFITLLWWIPTIFLAGESESTNKFIGESMLRNYGVRKDEFVYVSSSFYKTDENGDEYFSIPDLILLTIISTIILSGFSTILICWLCIRARLLDASRLQHSSQKTLKMQKDLLRALEIQTLFPVLLMFFPAGISMMFPLFKLEMGQFEMLILPMMTTEVFVDSLVPIFFVKDYRMAVLRVFGRKGENRVFSEKHYSFKTTKG